MKYGYPSIDFDLTNFAAHEMLRLHSAIARGFDKMKSKHAAKMNWKEVESEFQAGTLLVVPIGAGCKEHGLHLPNNTDQIQAEFFAEKIGDTRNILIMPTITYNFYPSFTHYAGSTSLPSDHCVQGYVELCEQWSKQGAQAIYFLNFAVSTNKPLKEAQAILAAKNIFMRFTDLGNYLRLLKELPEGLRPEQEGGAHADEVETSIMLAIDPTRVNMALAKKDFDDKPGVLVPQKPEAGSNDCYSPTGAWGDPSLATPEKGVMYVQKMMSFLLDDLALNLIHQNSLTL